MSQIHRSLRVGYAAEGEVIDLTEVDGISSEWTVLASCQDTEDECNSGHWMCLTHPHDNVNPQIATSSHTTIGVHKMLWVCHVHGPEAIIIKNKETADVPAQ